MNVIRWTASIYIMVCLMITIHLQAQEKHVPLQKKMQIMQHSLSIHSLSGLITAQTGLYLSFNANKIAAEKKIALQKRSYTVEELLELIKANTGIGYKVYQDHIIFHGGGKTGKGGHDDEFSSSEGSRQTANTGLASVKEALHTNKKEFATKVNDHSASKKKTSEKVTDLATNKKESSTQNADLSTNKKESAVKIKAPSINNKKGYSSTNKKESGSKITDLTTNNKDSSTKAIGFSINNKGSSTKTADLSTNKKESTTIATGLSANTKSKPLTPDTEAPKHLNIESLKASQTQTSTRTTLLYKPTFSGQHQREPRQTSKASWFVDGGLIIDEIPYLQPTIMGGHPLLHAIISWGTNFQVTGLRYGLGSSIPLKNDWRIGIQVTTGKMQRDFNFKGIRDTLKTITVKSDLHRLALQLEKPISRRLVVKAGPVFNLLKSAYFQEGNPATIATSGYAGTNGDREFYTIRPLYTLSNSFTTTTPSNTKSWIGFQASLFYRINF